MYCRYCGHKNEKGAKFCKNCGRSLPKKRRFALTAKNNGWISNHKKSLVFLLILLGLVMAFWLVFLPKYNNLSETSQISASVVNVFCDNKEGGSGTMFSSEGYVLTNNHVIAKSTYCLVTIPNTSTGMPEEIYVAVPLIVPTLSEQYDIALLKIDSAYKDSEGKTWGEYPKVFTAYQSPSSCTGEQPKLGMAVKIYGYPAASGGMNLTITDGIISSFSDDGDILTSAKVDSGNSGGLAVDDKDCMLGIPSAVLTGKYENLGVIIPDKTILEFVDKIPTDSK